VRVVNGHVALDLDGALADDAAVAAIAIVRALVELLYGGGLISKDEIEAVRLRARSKIRNAEEAQAERVGRLIDGLLPDGLLDRPIGSA
jgi:hypothetical protein